MSRMLLSVLLILIISTVANAKTAEDHFNEVVANVKSSDGSHYSYYGAYPGITREAGLNLAKAGDKAIAVHEDPATKGHFLYEINNPKMQISITFPNFGQDVPETRGNSNIRSPLVMVKRIAPRNAMFNKNTILGEIKSQLGEPDDYQAKGPVHTFHYGYIPKKSSRQLYEACADDFTSSHPGERMPKEISHVVRDKITIEAIQSILDICPSVIELYKVEKTKELSPWVWVVFNEKKRDFNVLMNYQGEEYLSPFKKDGPFYNK